MREGAEEMREGCRGNEGRVQGKLGKSREMREGYRLGDKG